MKKHLTRKLLNVLFTLCILPVSSVTFMSTCTAAVPASAKLDVVSVTYRFDESEILNWLGTKQLTKSFRIQSIAGEPSTLYKVAKILLPPYTEVVHVSVVGKVGGQRIVKDIPCGQPPVIIGEEPTIVGKNPRIYNSDKLYPSEIHRVGSVGSFHGYNILHVRLYPVQYKPASKLALYYKEMTVQVNLKQRATMTPLRNSVKDRETVEKLLDNPSILSTYDFTVLTTEPLGTIYEYIVITTPDLADEFQVLADWKDEFVDGAKVVTVNVGANDTEIKSIINDYYINHNTSYVLLGGDVGVITSHSKTVTIPGTPPVTADIAEDYWYANLVGDDDISFYEVYIGRAPVDNETDVANFVNKVIAYEQMDKPKANLFHQSRVQTGNNPDSRELAWQCEQCVPPDYTNYELFEENGKIEKTDWINFWRNDGIMSEHIGHGNQTSYDINYEVGGKVRWYNTDVASMNNTFWPVHTSAACFSGEFTYEDCLAEVYVKDPENGAVACLFNDKYGFYSLGDATKYSGDFIEMQFKALYQDGWTSIGAMLAYSKYYFIDEASNFPMWEWCWREINLIGDPETPLLTKRPKIVNVVKNSGWETHDNSFWNVSTIEEPYSSVDYKVNKDSACNGTYGFHVSMKTDSNTPQYTTQSLMESQSLINAMLDTNTKLKYRIYPAYELRGVSEIPQARWEIILSFSTGNKLHYYSSLNMEPTENSTDKYVYMPITLDQWNEFFDKKVLETYTSKFGTPPIGTIITRITAYVTSKTYAAKKNEFNRVIANFDSDEVAEGLRCGIWYVTNADTGLNYTTIQEAIDAPETLDGHRISVRGIFHEHVVVNKSLAITGEDPSTTIIDGNGTGTAITVQASNSAISQFTIRNGETGLYLQYSNNTSVIGNTVLNNYWGICLYENTENSIRNNIVSDNKYGIYSEYSDDNDVSGNIVSDNRDGIYSEYSDDNDVSGNTISENVWYGIRLWYCNNNTVSGNNMPNNGWDGIHQFFSNDNDISNNIISNGTNHGIYVDSSSGNSISSNIVSNMSDGIDSNYFGFGIHLGASNGNSVINNTLSNNEGGMLVWFASNNNTICYNKFDNWIQVRNEFSENIWDDGYPSGGNYWSDYNVTDLYSGPHQNETGSDGIGDTSYVIDEYNQDNYPLMQPWKLKNIDTGLTYSTIQEAIDAPETSAGDTIMISVGMFHEHVVVNKSLTLKGINPSTAIIDGGGTGTVVSVQANDVTISKFAIQNGETGIQSYSGNVIISGNVVSNCYDHGIGLWDYSSNSYVNGNTISNTEKGIEVHLDRATCFSLSGNTISNTSYGMWIYGTVRYIADNTISSSYCGIYLESGTIVVDIIGNTISTNDYGLFLDSNTIIFYAIYHNNFMNNTKQASCASIAQWDRGGEGNYWSDYTGQDLDGDGIGDTPYVIDENNQDNYPLMGLWP